MTYDPQTISRSIMFIANKAEGHHFTGERYASSLPKTTHESVLAPEFMIVQALRFNFEVRHPFRGLKGGHLEMMEMAKEKAATISGAEKSPTDLQREMSALPKKVGGPATKMTPQELEKRITDAYGFASHILKTAALLTDAYFLYTPSHIWLSAHLLADEPLTLLYLSTKLPPSNPSYTKLLNTLRACASLLSSHRSFNVHTSSAEKEALDKKDREEVSVLMKKLRQCRDPDKIDLVKLNQAQKRDALSQGAEGELEESKAKRRKLAREKSEKAADEFWGPELPKKDSGTPGA
jgi:cyclin H